MERARLTGKSRGNEAEGEDDVENAHVTELDLSYGLDRWIGDELAVGVLSSCWPSR
jgi:hypothetical protein